LNFVGFADSTLPDAVTYGRQALARHEHRKFFVPNIWEEPLPARRKGDLNAKPTSSLTVNGLSSIPRLKQVWFDGAHSNVGGGYDRDPLAFLSLTWMVNEAEQCGLGLDTTALQTEVVSAEKNGSDGKGYLETCIRHPFWSFRLQFMAVAAALTAFALVLPAARTVLQAVVLKGLHAVDYVMIRATLPDIVWSPIAHHPWIAAIWIAWILSLFVQSSRRTKLERALHTQIHWSVYDRGRPPDVPNRKYEPTGNMKSYYQAGGEQPTSIAVAP
jgi:hypothetical protein